MKVVDTLYGLVGRMTGRDRIRQLGEFLEKAGINVVPEMFAGFMITSWVILVFSSYAIARELAPQYYWIVTLVVAVGMPLLTYTLIVLRIDARKNEVENVLPDFLQLAASNVRAGMPIDRAVWFAARPEFGLLSKEGEIVAKRTFGGEPFAQSLRKLSARFDSKALKRTVTLIIDGMASGGQMAEILERTAWDIRQMQLLRKEISAMLVMYIIFIVFAAVIGAPLLFGLSYQLISIITFIWGEIMAQNPEGLPQAGMTFIRPSPPGVSPEQFYLFSIVASVITMTNASLIIATIQTGSKKNGIKYLPFFIAGGITIFFLVSFFFSWLFSGILQA